MPRLPPLPANAYANLEGGAHSRGFTLIETLASLAVASVVGLGMMSAAIWQSRTYFGHISELNAQRQAEVVWGVLEETTGLCGIGYGHANDAAGLVPTGICMGDWATEDYPPTYDNPVTQAVDFVNPEGLSFTTKYRPRCAKLDNGGRNDRLRLAWTDFELAGYTEAPTAPSAGPCGTDTSSPDPTLLHFAEYGGAPPAPSGWVDRSIRAQIGMSLLGGTCQGSTGPAAGTDLLRSPSVPILALDSRQCDVIINYERLTTGAPVLQQPLSCPQGYAPGFSMGYPYSRELFTKVDPTTGVPALMVANTYSTLMRQTHVAAVGVTRFEVRYGFDTSNLRDHKLHACPGCTEDPYGTLMGGPHTWCREARASDQGGSCALRDENGTALTTADLLNRIVAIHVTLEITPTQQSSATSKLGTGTVRTFERMFYLPNVANG